jgi:uncharacterized OsmC-like protein
MVEICIEYQGGLRCQATHGPSGCELTTDAPVDNHGKGESFSPTDLLATALATCISTIMGIYAQRHDVDLSGMKIAIEKHMSAEAPRRIAKLPMKITMPVGIEDRHRSALEEAVQHCPVHRSLHPDVQTPVEFVYAS